MLFAQIRIERTDVPLGIDMQLDRRIGDLEKPRLRVMRAGGQNRGAHQRERGIVSGFPPVLPRFVSPPLTDAEDSLIPGAPDASTHDGDGYNSCASDKGSPLHEAPPPTFRPSRPLPLCIRN